ncbi:hypothetical protein VTK73DRAFT_1421 [Phialemonium thermophilum]|uniref:Secreted protein n=1 Tax=Phialemonium thermophilum TaxID=223376 RepID=A0ABR3VTI2_9PEZI
MVVVVVVVVVVSAGTTHVGLRPERRRTAGDQELGLGDGDVEEQVGDARGAAPEAAQRVGRVLVARGIVGDDVLQGRPETVPGVAHGQQAGEVVGDVPRRHLRGNSFVLATRTVGWWRRGGGSHDSVLLQPPSRLHIGCAIRSFNLGCTGLFPAVVRPTSISM